VRPARLEAEADLFSHRAIVEADDLVALLDPIFLGRRVLDDRRDLADIHRHSHLPKSLRRDGDFDRVSRIRFAVNLEHDRFRTIFHEELLQLREI
jgi:hypothetical protein